MPGASISGGRLERDEKREVKKKSDCEEFMLEKAKGLNLMLRAIERY